MWLMQSVADPRGIPVTKFLSISYSFQEIV